MANCVMKTDMLKAGLCPVSDSDDDYDFRCAGKRHVKTAFVSAANVVRIPSFINKCRIPPTPVQTEIIEASDRTVTEKEDSADQHADAN